MDRIVAGYRDWADMPSAKIRVRTPGELLQLNPVGAEILFLGWSWMIPLDMLVDNSCIVAHPSKLPEYRGGTPLQHQINDGLTETELTFFRPTMQTDHGPVVARLPLDLSGTIPEIYSRMWICSLRFHREIWDKVPYMGLDAYKNDELEHPQPPPRKRIKPSESRLNWAPDHWFGVHAYNKIRGLTGPYPRAYIRFLDGRLYLEEVRWEPNE